MNSPRVAGQKHPLLERIFARRILPAVGVCSPSDAVAVARALLQAGLDVMEITFRHRQAPECLAAIRQSIPEMLIGAGTLLSEIQLDAAVHAGAQFGVTPGFNPQIVRAAHARQLFLIPGIATPGELEQAIALGSPAVKIFPVEPLGGVPFIKALSGPYLQTGIKVIPMGGVNLENLSSYVNLPLVGAAGGSWMISEKDIVEKNWSHISEQASAALRVAKTAG